MSAAWRSKREHIIQPKVSKSLLEESQDYMELGNEKIHSGLTNLNIGIQIS